MSEKDRRPEEDASFNSYLSTTIIRTGAVFLGAFIIIAAILIALPFFRDNVGLAIFILLCGVIVAACLTVSTFVFLNMSDDLKLLGEEVTILRKDIMAFHKSTSSFFDASVEYMQNHLDAVDELLENKKH